MTKILLYCIQTSANQRKPTCNDIDVESTESTIARAICVCIGNLGCANTEEISWSVSSTSQCDNARVVSGSWLCPGNGGSGGARSHCCGDVTDAVNDGRCGIHGY